MRGTVALALAFFLCACGEKSTQTLGGGHRSDYEAVSASRELRKDERAVLLVIPKVGRFAVACRGQGMSEVEFVADRLLPTAAVTVASSETGTSRRTVDPGGTLGTRGPTARPRIETWQIAPFSKGARSVTTITISVGRSAGGPFYACGFSAQGLAPA